MDLDILPVSHARLTVVGPALFEWDSFEMTAPSQSPAKCEVRDIHKQIVAVYGNVMNPQNVTKWRLEFLQGRTDVQDELRSSRLSLISDDLLQEIEGEIRAHRCVTMRELHHIIPEVSKTTIHEAVTEKLGYRKLCARWVLRMITDDDKTKRMGSALKFLTLCAQEGDEFLDSIVTEDKTWGFHHTPESRQQSLPFRRQ